MVEVVDQMSQAVADLQEVGSVQAPQRPSAEQWTVIVRELVAVEAIVDEVMFQVVRMRMELPTVAGQESEIAEQ